jgi:hypothetical protein
MERFMARRKDETAEEWRIRHREEERLRREDPEYAAKIAAYKQRDDVKARHAAQERERRKTKQVKAYAREYQRERAADPEYAEKKKQYQAAWYQANKERTKEANKAWAKANRDKMRGYYLAWERRNPRHTMVERARSSAKQRSLEFTITVDSLVWPTHCPIFGIELCYERDKKAPHRDNYPTFDRWDNAVGYVPGNVFVISWLANRMKWHATIEQLEAILRYMKEKPALPHGRAVASGL